MVADPIIHHRADHPDGRRFGLGLSLIAAAGLGIRVAYLVLVGRHITPGFDALWYELQAGTIARGPGFVDPDAFYRLGIAVPTANFPPLWPVLLAATNRIGLSTQTEYQAVGALLGTGTVVVTGLLGRRVVSPAVGLVAAAIVALSPMLVAADGSLMAESIYVLLVTAALLAAYRAIERPTFARFATTGALLGFAVLARSDGIFLVLLVGGVAAWRAPIGRPGPTTGRRIALGLSSVVVAVLVLVPWTAYSSSRLDEPVLLSTNSGSVLEGANCPSTYGGALLGAWDEDCLEQTRRTGTTEIEWSAAGRRSGIDYALDHPAKLPLVGTTRVLRTWGVWDPIAQTRLEAVESRSEHWQLVGWSFDALVLVLAAGGVVLLRRRGVTVAPLVAVVLAVTVAAALAWGNGRFRLAAAPALAVLAATVLLALFEPLTANRGRVSGGARPVSEDVGNDG